MDDAHQSWLLQLEPAATIDAGKPLVKAAHHLEGDSLLAFESYEIIATVLASVHKNHHSNATEVARQLSAGKLVAMSQMIRYALSCIQPGLLYFTTQLRHSWREIL